MIHWLWMNHRINWLRTSERYKIRNHLVPCNISPILFVLTSHFLSPLQDFISAGSTHPSILLTMSGRAKMTKVGCDRIGVTQGMPAEDVATVHITHSVYSFKHVFNKPQEKWIEIKMTNLLFFIILFFIQIWRLCWYFHSYPAQVLSSSSCHQAREPLSKCKLRPLKKWSLVIQWAVVRKQQKGYRCPDRNISPQAVLSICEVVLYRAIMTFWKAAWWHFILIEQHQIRRLFKIGDVQHAMTCVKQTK